MTKEAANRERKAWRLAFVEWERKQTVARGSGEEVVRGKSWKRVVEPKGEPAGNLKGKFAGWLALVGVWSGLRSLLAPLALNCRSPPEAFHTLASAISLPFRPFLAGCLSLSRSF